MRISTEQRVRDLAASFGFDEVRFAAVDPPAGIDAYDRFIAEDRHGDMGWMERSRGPRADPRMLLPDARSVIVLGLNYAHPPPPDPGGLTGRVASYAWGRDYHNHIGKRLQRLTRDLRAAIPGLETYAGVDSRPLIERAWAQASGLGFIGKNAMAILPGKSSYFFLAAILVNIDLEPDSPMSEHCGSCQRCLIGCPTQAFTAPAELDARRCISYLTIEYKGIIPDTLKPKMGRWVFGCDVCQDVCPHNPRQPHPIHDDFAPRADHAWPDLPGLMDATDAELGRRFVGSPIRRAGADGLRRNAAIALGNIGDRAAIPVLTRRLHDPNEATRDAVRWALEQL